MTDAILKLSKSTNVVDFNIDSDGDILQADFFDTAILVSIYEERRAAPEEVSLPERRRGWIGNESTPDFERGSKIWLYSQSRLNRDSINGIISAANDALQWIVDQNYATSIKVDVTYNQSKVTLLVIIDRPDSITIRKELFLWDNSGITEV